MKALCKETRAALSAWLDGEVGPEEGARIENHLARCGRCRGERDALSRTRALLAGSGRLPTPEAWVREAVRRASRPARDPGREARRIAPAPVISRPWVISSLAAAAVLALVFVTVGKTLLQRAGPSTPIAGDSAGALTPPSREKAPAAADEAQAPEGPPADLPAPSSIPRARPVAQESAEAAKPIKERAPRAPEPAESIETLRLTLAQIRFPEAEEQVRSATARKVHAPSGDLRTFATEAERLPATLQPPGEKKGEPAAAARVVRVRVLLDALSNRILEVRDPIPEGDDRIQRLAARLPGATIAIESAPPSPGSEALLRAEKSRSAGPAAAHAAPPIREVILEIVLEEPPSP